MKLAHLPALSTAALVSLGLAGGVASAHDVTLTHAPVHETGLSAGIAVGDVTAFDMKLWFLPHSGLDLGIGVNEFTDRLALYGEFEFALAEWGMGNSTRGIFYMGPGLQGVFNDPHEELSFVAPIGFDFQFVGNPIDVFVEARPGILLSPDVTPVIGAQAGVRAIF